MTRNLFAHDEGSGPPLVLLHGFGGHHGIWEACLAALDVPARIIAYDLPGHGASLEPGAAASPRRSAAALLDDLAGRVPGPFHLAGHSMGGAIATLMAAAAPDRVASLTLLAPGGFGETINEPALRTFADAASEDELAEALCAMAAPGFRPAQSAVAALATVRALPGQRQALAALVAAIARDGRQGVIPPAMLEAIGGPVTVIWGDKDPVLAAPTAGTLPAHCHLDLLPGAGHMLPDERPGAVATALGRALAGG